MKRLLFVFAHPDDESMFGGTIAHYAGQGDQVSLICATKGEAGEISDPALASQANLGTTREAELRCACDRLGVSQLHLLGYCDSGMDGTPENELPTAFIQADSDEIRFKLVRLIRQIKPHAIVTFEPGGWYGHPDHIAAGRYAGEAFRLAADPGAFQTAGPAWQAKRLFHAVFLFTHFKPIIEHARQLGLDTSDFEELPFDKYEKLAGQITHRLNISKLHDQKWEAMLCHRSQFGEDHLIRSAPAELRRALLAEEDFIQVEPPAKTGSTLLGDLFGD